MIVMVKMNPSKKDSAKVKRYEIEYNRWLKKVIKTFGKVTREAAINLLYSEQELSEDLVKVFMDKLNLDKVNFTFDGVLKENLKFIERQSTKEVKKRLKGKKKVSELEKIINEILPQKIASSAITTNETIVDKKNFFELQKDIIESQLEIIYEKRKNQLDVFRSSFLLDTQDKKELFNKKYKEPKYKFTDTVSRTQVNNLNRDLAASMATNVGASKGEWVTSNDERVRESHRELNGKVFYYNKLPSEYNDYNCRCSLLPIFDFLNDL